VAVDRRFKIAGEVLVKRSPRSMFFGKTKRLRKQTDMRFSGTNHRHRPHLIADHDFDSGTHPCPHVSKVAGGFRFRDVDDAPRLKDILSLLTFLPSTPSTSSLAVFFWYRSYTQSSSFAGRIRSGHQDNCSFRSAYTGEHIACIFLLSRQPGFDIHLNEAAQNSRGARAA